MIEIRGRGRASRIGECRDEAEMGREQKRLSAGGSKIVGL